MQLNILPIPSLFCLLHPNTSCTYSGSQVFCKFSYPPTPFPINLQNAPHIFYSIQTTYKISVHLINQYIFELCLYIYWVLISKLWPKTEGDGKIQSSELRFMRYSPQLIVLPSQLIRNIKFQGPIVFPYKRRMDGDIMDLNHWILKPITDKKNALLVLVVNQISKWVFQMADLDPQKYAHRARRMFVQYTGHVECLFSINAFWDLIRTCVFFLKEKI